MSSTQPTLGADLSAPASPCFSPPTASPIQRLERHAGVELVHGVQWIVRVIAIHRIEGVVRVVVVDRVCRIAGIILVDRIEGIVGVVLVHRIERIIWLVLCDRVEDVVVPLVAWIEAWLAVTDRRPQEHRYRRCESCRVSHGYLPVWTNRLPLWSHRTVTSEVLSSATQPIAELRDLFEDRLEERSPWPRQRDT